MAQRATAKICFLYIAQAHQVLHSLTIAVELARGWPQYEVHLVATDAEQLSYIDTALERLGGAPVKTRLLGPAWLRKVRLRGSSTPPKAAMLLANLMAFAGYDAVVTPERTTALIRRLGVRRPALIYTQHGAGDRGGTFEPRLGLFDVACAPGPKYYHRMIDNGLVEPDRCAIIGYPKFDAVEALSPHPQSPFSDERPVVVYNPHFDFGISSWPAWGLKVLQHFAENDRYNLIFAPHIRLFELLGPEGRATLAPFHNHPRIHIDLGGPAAIDMTYTRVADLYLGDASSQVYEFLRTLKPTAFLNAHAVDWREDESHRHWHYGPVVERIETLGSVLDEAFATHATYIDAQRAGMAETFALDGPSSSRRAAEVIVTCVAQRARA